MLKRYFVIFNRRIQINRESHTTWGYSTRSYALTANRLKLLKLPIEILDTPINGKIIVSGTKI